MQRRRRPMEWRLTRTARREFRVLLLALTVLPAALLIVLAAPMAPVAAAPACSFGDGFAALRAQIGAEVVGECLEDAHATPDGNVEQTTTGGLLVWEKATNLTRFTDGAQTWVSGPNGVETRPNDQMLPWERELETNAGQRTNISPAELAMLYVEAVRGNASVQLEHIYAAAFELARQRLPDWLAQQKALALDYASGMINLAVGRLAHPSPAPAP